MFVLNIISLIRHCILIFSFSILFVIQILIPIQILSYFSSKLLLYKRNQIESNEAASSVVCVMDETTIGCGNA